MKIPVVFSVDKNYVMPLVVALTSMYERKNEKTEYETYILLSSDIGEEDIQIINKVFKRYNTDNVKYINMKNEYQDAYIPSELHYSEAIYYRLSIYNLLPNFVKKCIYCDCDIIIECDLSELFNLELNNNLVAGVYDKYARYLSGGNWYQKTNDYINSGIMILNLEKWRSHNLIEKMLPFLDKELLCPDQDIINIVCKDKKLVLPFDKYVVNFPLSEDNRNINRIIHFNSVFKPWKYTFDNPYYETWNKYAIKAGYDELVKQRQDDYKKINSFFKYHLKKRVILWGARVFALEVRNLLKQFGIKTLAIGDNDLNKIGQKYDGIQIISINDIKNYHDVDYIIITLEKHYDSVREQLINNAIPESNIFMWKNLLEECKK